MGEPVKKGTKIPLSLQLSNDITNAFVEAELADANKVLLGASPVILAHTTLGHYTNNAVTFPDTDRVFAFLRIFTDATKANRHPLHCDTFEDIFPLKEVVRPSDLVAEIDDGSGLSAVIFDDSILIAEIVENELTAAIESQDTLIAEVIDPEILKGEI